MRAKTKIACVLAIALSLGALGIVGCSNRNPSLKAEPNQRAALAGALPFNPMKDKVITSWIDRRNSTMSTLYGNDVAVEYARTNDLHSYPTGSVLAVVTWKQQEDPRWFGARIPATAKSVEYVTVKSASDGKQSYLYQIYAGTPLKEMASDEGAVPDERARWLLSQRAAVMP